MQKIYLASRSDLGTIVLEIPPDSPARPLPPVLFLQSGQPMPYEWGPQAKDVRPLVEALFQSAHGPYFLEPALSPPILQRRMEANSSPVWCLTQSEVVAGMVPAR